MKRFSLRWSMPWQSLSVAAVLAAASVSNSLPTASTTAPYVPSDAERARWTMSDMRSLATAVEAYAVDHKAYPSAATFEAVVLLIQPNYMRKAPATDAWGHAYVYLPAQDRQSYRLVSGGSDGTTDPGSWSVAGVLSSFNEDAVVDSGSIVRSWPYR
jgi:general secretion pathway protein G